jgi:hypothetical protein
VSRRNTSRGVATAAGLCHVGGMSKAKRIPEFTEHVVIRMAPELRQAIETAAEQDRRPVSHLIRNVLSDWIEGRSADGDRAGRAA